MVFHPLFTGLLQALLSSPTYCSCISFHAPLIQNFSWYSPKWSQFTPRLGQISIRVSYRHPVFGDWLRWVNLECKILLLRGGNFSKLILPGLWNEGFLKSQWESSAFRRITCIHRVRTNFWIQNSWLFPDYFQNNSLFSQTQGHQIIMWSKETLKNAGTRLFYRMHCKLTVTTVQCRHKRIMNLLILWLSWLRARLNGIWPWKKFTY